jgi:hypothetical protein
VSDTQRVAAGSRRAALREAAIVAGLGIAAIGLIPSQTTSGPVLGLPPAFLPTVCAVAIVALTVLGLGVRLWKPEPLRPERSAPWWPAALVLGVAMAGVLVLEVLGPFACGLAVVVLGLAAMRERRVGVLLTTLAVTALVLGAVYQVWR